MRLKLPKNILHLLLIANVAQSFHISSGSGSINHVGGITTLFSSSTLEDQDAKPKKETVVVADADADANANTTKKKNKPVYIKNEREQIAKKKDFYRGAGVFRDVKADVTKDMREQFDSDLMNKMKEDPNYMIEKDGVEFYLAKDHGFCWGG